VPWNKKFLAALALTGAALFGAGVAHADQESSTDAPVDIGASCPHADLNEIVPDTDGGVARCMYTSRDSGFFWGTNDGMKQPWVIGTGPAVPCTPQCPPPGAGPNW
jgi:hypothetical protein